MMAHPTPYVEIAIYKLKKNAMKLNKLLSEKGIKMTAVVKGVGGDIEITKTLIESGISNIADSNIKNIIKLKKAGLHATYTLLRTPALSEIEQVISYTDISMNSEIQVVQALASEAMRQKKRHSIIIMVEMGDLREGVMPNDLPNFIEAVLKLPFIQIVGIGTNLSCMAGVIPTEMKMKEFSSLVLEMQKQFSLELPYISGGNSANYLWLKHAKDPGLINNLRIGEALFLGRETVNYEQIPGLSTDAFTFHAEVIESKIKPSIPSGKVGKNAFGNSVTFQDKGQIRRAIIGVGRQNVLVEGLTPLLPVEILGSSSDHIALDSQNINLQPGDIVSFAVDYGALLSLMTSPYVFKKYIYTAQTSPPPTSATSA